VSRLLQSLLSAMKALLAALARFPTRFHRAPVPERRALTEQEEQEIAAIRTWLGEHGVWARFERGRKGDVRPVFAVDRLIYQDRRGRNGWVGAPRDGDEVRAWRALRRSVEHQLDGRDELCGL
jgi:hypothetical protein